MKLITAMILTAISQAVAFVNADSASTSTPAPVFNPADLMEAKTFTSLEGLSIAYRVHKPKAEVLAEGTKLPVVLFLHGAGERGDDNTAQFVHCIKPLLRFVTDGKHPAIVIAPQCPAGMWWSFGPSETNAPPISARQTNTLRAVLDIMKIEADETIADPARIYVSGISMGGYGTWELIARHPEKFAAAMPICGGGDPATASALTNLPIRVFHGAKDNVVIPEKSRVMVEAIKAAGGEKIEYVEYPEAWHDSWTQTYDDTANLEWMFGQMRKCEK